MSSNKNQPPFEPTFGQPYSQPPKPEMPPYGSPLNPVMGPPPPEPPKKKTGCTCMGCMLGCAGVSLVLLIVGGIGAYMLVQRAPDMARGAIQEVVNESDLAEEDKKVVMTQVDRLVDGYKEGKVDLQKLGKVVEGFAESPLMDLMIAYAARTEYIEESGLTDEEKAEADQTVQRVARGVIEEKISSEDLDVALNHISNDLGNGGRQFRDEVSDDELRAFIKECKRLADEAEISDEPYQVDIGAELKKLVDEALGEAEATKAPQTEPGPAPEAPLPPDPLQPEKPEPEAATNEV